MLALMWEDGTGHHVLGATADLLKDCLFADSV